jgi:hypothetical protein
VSTEEDLAAIKAATRELHEAIQEARAARRELQTTWMAIDVTIAGTVETMIEKHVAKGLADYEDALKTAIENATEAVYKRFDKITDILLGEDKKQARRGDPTIEELARQRGSRFVRRPR